ncbi:MAG: YciI family protein [Bacteroidales bacterium]|nr:YciI family protein [Bacteroidales bacterium]
MKKIFMLIGFLVLTSMIFSQSTSGKYFVFLNTNPDRPKIPEAEIDAIQAAHMANMDSLAKIKRLLAAGPFHGGGGLQVLVATSQDDAQKLVNSDPAVKAHRFNTEIYPLEMGVGGICPVQEPYEMVEYQFIRFVPVPAKIAEESDKKIEKLSKRHLSYLKANFFKRGLIGNGDFGAGNGGFLLAFKTDDEEFETFLKYDPMVRSELYTIDTRILWIAQGTFCERKPEK